MPTTFNEMLLFNASVMGFGSNTWLLPAWDAIRVWQAIHAVQQLTALLVAVMETSRVGASCIVESIYSSLAGQVDEHHPESV